MKSFDSCKKHQPKQVSTCKMSWMLEWMVHTARREPAPTGFRPLRIDLWVVTHPDSETHNFKKNVRERERGRERGRLRDYVSTVTISESIHSGSSHVFHASSDTSASLSQRRWVWCTFLMSVTTQRGRAGRRRAAAAWEPRS